ncbi:ABC transporter substrate-binding protein [Sabulicella glaciei]|uniref:ABC transporter substrate-binding protein n=1 Tax=Sabulicella glaciei TaxID=2984948 RepID=A0ABT3NQ80_9PROT|nr:ABC transporter substrate-binding protein [Roseococcus sp. MDT2-1-1]MCW8084023.1 ABC transporter substrate-binding protein [Roseococcus sp. MDT2-1-1]
MILPRRALLAAPGLLAACGDGTAPSWPRIVAPGEFAGLDLSRAGHVLGRMGVVETLVGADEAGRPTPELAVSWAVSADHAEWRFRLRPGARFHDGTPVDATSVASALSHAAAGVSVLARAPLAGIAPDGEDVVVFRLHRPFAPLPAFLSHAGSGVLAPGSFGGSGRVDRVIGSGPFRVAQIHPPHRLLVARWEGWWGAAPRLPGALYLATGQGETRAVMVESGEAQIAIGLLPASLARLRRRVRVAVASVPTPRVRMLKLDAASPFFRDQRVREALSLALDREGIAGALLRDATLATDQLFPPALADWHDPSLGPSRQDLAGARALLEAAGWRPGPGGIRQDALGQRFAVELRTFTTWPELPAMATAIQAQLREAGIAVSVSIGSSSDIPRGHRDGRLQMGLFTRQFGLVPDPLGTVLSDYGQAGGDWGAMNWHSEELLALAASLGTTPDRSARRRIGTILREERPVIPIASSTLAVAATPRLRGLRLDPFELRFHLQELDWPA